MVNPCPFQRAWSALAALAARGRPPRMVPAPSSGAHWAFAQPRGPSAGAALPLAAGPSLLGEETAHTPGPWASPWRGFPPRPHLRRSPEDNTSAPPSLPGVHLPLPVRTGVGIQSHRTLSSFPGPALNVRSRPTVPSPAEGQVPHFLRGPTAPLLRTPQQPGPYPTMKLWWGHGQAFQPETWLPNSSSNASSKES